MNLIGEGRFIPLEIMGSYTCYAQTMPGIEKITWLEIRKRFPRVKFLEFLFAKDKNGIVIWEFNGDPSDLLALRTAEDVFLLIASLEKLSRDWPDLRTVATLIQESILLDQAARIKKRSGRVLTYRVISRKEGNHRYRRMDFEAAVVKGIERRYGTKWQIVEDDADIEIWANILGSRLLCGIRLSDRAMRHREYKVVNLPASLRPSVAAAMVFLTEPSPQDVFIDPMCGGGTIIAERLLAGPYKHVLGGDILNASAQASVKNVASFLQPSVICNLDACQLPLLSGSVDKVSVNLPFGKQIGTRPEIETLYPRFFAELERVLKQGGRASVLSSEFELVKNVVRTRPKLQVLTGYSIAVLGQWGRIYIITKT